MELLHTKNEVYIPSYYLIDYRLFKRLLVLKYCRQKGFESKRLEKVTDNEEISRISKSRAKRCIKEIVLCNDFTHFFTQTLNNNNDRYNLEEFVKTMQKKLKAYKRKYKDFKYVIVYEKHKNGAFHLHGLLGGLGNDLYVNDYGHLSLKSFENLRFRKSSSYTNRHKRQNKSCKLCYKIHYKRFSSNK